MSVNTAFETSDLPKAEFMFPGPERDRLVKPLGKVTDRYAIDEGEGDVTAAQWRSAHESFWNSAEYRDEFANPNFPLNDNSLIVFEHFEVEQRLESNNALG